MSKEIIAISRITRAIFIAGGAKGFLDADLARRYGVTTGNLNKAVRRNHDRFPADFTFRFTWVPSYAFTEQMLSSLWTGDRTRLACNRQSGSDRWRPRHRELFQFLLLDKFEIKLKESFSARRRKAHARRACSPD